ncbi:GNAT family N-acetyltransferase [Armatimonas rosea]|uniref:GNAT superfamily N-acetyltransferase n=1 Tax=Armatimonas rosea TaxID=685828 RepID=A0A7W9W7T2_ARMRO|nr:GNAT family N-acetyltransferase [Armatimonas rosea]MBB6052008.1 GNAT superfamily N-acetyltransferase [Armatimonas rosea]
MTVARATSAELPALAALYDDTVRWLSERGVSQWQVGEHSVERLAQTDAYVAWEDKRAVGGFLFVPPDPVLWPDTDTVAARYLAGLVLARSHAGQGQALLTEAACHAATPRLRLDCWDGNEALKAFYTRAGFTDCGTVPEQTWVVRRFEKEFGEGRQ